MENWELILKNNAIRPIKYISRKKNAITINFFEFENVFSLNDILNFLLFTKDLRFKLEDNKPKTYSIANDRERFIFKILGIQKHDILRITDSQEDVFLIF